MKLDEYIESVLNDKKINMTVAAQKAGIATSTLSRLKAGSSELTPSLAAKLSVVGFDCERMFEINAQENIEKTKQIIEAVNS